MSYNRDYDMDDSDDERMAQNRIRELQRRCQDSMDSRSTHGTAHLSAEGRSRGSEVVQYDRGYGHDRQAPGSGYGGGGQGQQHLQVSSSQYERLRELTNQSLEARRTHGDDHLFEEARRQNPASRGIGYGSAGYPSGNAYGRGAVTQYGGDGRGGYNAPGGYTQGAIGYGRGESSSRRGESSYGRSNPGYDRRDFAYDRREEDEEDDGEYDRTGSRRGAGPYSGGSGSRYVNR